MPEEQKLLDFPDYCVTDDGKIFNNRTGRELHISRTRRGIAKVTMYQRGVAVTRSVAPLVAKAFVWNDFDPDIFDTPIHLNQDPLDNRAENLRWRPRWFAIKYAKQYWRENYHVTGKFDIYDSSDGEILPGIRYVCEKHGVLWFDVAQSLHEGKKVFPVWYTFSKL